MSMVRERFATMRINWYMGPNKLFNINQSGIRKRRNMLDQLIRLCDHNLKGVTKKSCVGGIFFI